MGEHTRGVGHDLRTCPFMSPEERTRRNSERRVRSAERTAAAAARRAAQVAANIASDIARSSGTLGNISVDSPRHWSQRKQQVKLVNPNAYAVCVFWCYRVQGNNTNDPWKMFTTVISELGGSTTLLFTRNHNLKVVPIEEITSNDPTNVAEMFEVDLLDGANYFDNAREDREFIYNIPSKAYTPSLDPLTMWKNAGLKSMYLLKELIRLGARDNDTYDVILDLVQDINLPEFTEMDKEQAGIPSAFTNLT